MEIGSRKVESMQERTARVGRVENVQKCVYYI